MTILLIEKNARRKKLPRASLPVEGYAVVSVLNSAWFHLQGTGQSR